MDPGFLDRYTHLDTFVHSLDPRTRILTTGAFVLAVLALPSVEVVALAGCLVLILGLSAMATLPLRFVLKRSLAIFPFVLLTAASVPFLHQGEAVASLHIGPWMISISRRGIVTLWTVAAKSWLSMLALIFLSATTPFPRLLKGLERLGVPRVMAMILSFMYRYMFVLVDEMTRMRRARDSRSFGGAWLWQVTTIGRMIGTTFIRTYERAERVYAAMLARGYSGHIPSVNELSIRSADVWFSIGFALCLTAIMLSVWR